MPIGVPGPENTHGDQGRVACRVMATLTSGKSVTFHSTTLRRVPGGGSCHWIDAMLPGTTTSEASLQRGEDVFDDAPHRSAVSVLTSVGAPNGTVVNRHNGPSDTS